jgi:hypothetical protein
MKWKTLIKLAIVAGLAAMYAFGDKPVCTSGDGSETCKTCNVCWASTTSCGCAPPAL